MIYPSSGPITLKVNLADSPLVASLKSGKIQSDLVKLDFCGPKTANQGFKPMVREGEFDCGELAIVTFLQALEYGKPLVLTPAVVVGRFQHRALVYNSEKREKLGPKDLEGRRVAVRAYSQTTGAWVRALLQHEYGVDLERLTWLCWDDPHPAEYVDPPNVIRAPRGGRSLNETLLDGDVDAAVAAGEILSNPIIKPVIADIQNEAKAWNRKYQGAVPINHMFVMRSALSRERPDVVGELYRMLLESKRAAPPSKDGLDQTPFGVEANRRSLELIIQYALEQKLISRTLKVDELFDKTTRALG